MSRINKDGILNFNVGKWVIVNSLFSRAKVCTENIVFVREKCKGKTYRCERRKLNGEGHFSYTLAFETARRRINYQIPRMAELINNLLVVY